MSPSDLLGDADGLRNHQPPRQVGRTTLLGLTASAKLRPREAPPGALARGGQTERLREAALQDEEGAAGCERDARGEQPEPRLFAITSVPGGREPARAKAHRRVGGRWHRGTPLERPP